MRLHMKYTAVQLVYAVVMDNYLCYDVIKVDTQLYNNDYN